MDKRAHPTLAVAGVLLAVVSLSGCGKNPVTSPNPSTQWEQTAGPIGGRILSFVASGRNIFAGTGGGLFRSADDGASWSPASNGLPPSYSDRKSVV